MYPFTYQRPTSIQDAVAAFATAEDAKLIAGGHTLLPTMKLRLASPATRGFEPNFSSPRPKREIDA